MKKLLVLALVLAVSTIANAGFLMSPTGSNVPGVYTINIAADGITADYYLAIAVQGAGTLSNFAKGVTTPADADLTGTTTVDGGVGYLGQGEVWGMAHFSTPSVYPAGTWLTATLTGVNGDVVKAYSSTDYVEFTEIGSFVVTPEPITVALLGLGGLFLRRKA